MGNPFWNPYQRGRFKFGAAGIVAAVPSAAVFLLLHDVLGLPLSLVWYISGLLFYTVFAFGYAYVDDNSTLFSEKDRRPRRRLIAVHLGYLLALLLVIQTAEYLKPHLPASMISESRKGSSWFEVIVFVAVAIVFFVEVDWLEAEEDPAPAVE